jgi:hypothetical protein
MTKPSRIPKTEISTPSRSSLPNSAQDPHSRNPAIPVGRGVTVGSLENQEPKPHEGSRGTSQDPPPGAYRRQHSERQQHQLNRLPGQRPTRTDTDTSQHSPLLEDPLQVTRRDLWGGEVDPVDGHIGGKARDDQPDNRDRKGLTKGVESDAPRESTIHRHELAIPEPCAGTDTTQDQDIKRNDEGRQQPRRKHANHNLEDNDDGKNPAEEQRYEQAPSDSSSRHAHRAFPCQALRSETKEIRVGADPPIPKKPSKRNVATSKPSGHPYPPDRDEPQRAPADPVHSHAGGDPFRANLRVEDVGGNRNRSEEGVNRKGSRELPIHKPAFAIPEARVGVDHKGGLKDNDGGRHQSYGNNSAAFRSFFLFLNSSAADTW